MSESSETTANTSLSVRGLRKTYGGVVAIKNIDFEIRTGKTHGL
jgi:ABC-type sugar transport system ATPase subunit